MEFCLLTLSKFLSAIVRNDTLMKCNENPPKRLFQREQRNPACLGSVIAVAVIATFISACGASEQGRTEKDSSVVLQRDPKWASPLELPGLPNLHTVAPNIYRGAQPLPEGFVSLKKLGVRTIVNFRRHSSDLDGLKQIGLEHEFKVVEIPMYTWDLTDERAAEFLRIVENEENLPVFYHCKHGADRTGAMTAIFRISHQGWSVEDAILEMTEGSFGYHSIWTNLIAYLKKYDTNRIRAIIKN